MNLEMTAPVRPALSYEYVDDLAVVSCYFNPAGFAIKRGNFETFEGAMRRSELALSVVECAFGEEAFTLNGREWVTRVRARDVMWQKERLLNVAIAGLPKKITKVAWVDADVLFANAGWAVECSQLLESFAVVQPFDRVIRLPRGQTQYHGEGDCWEGFASVFRRFANLMLQGDFARHGHTGFAWAARREVIEKHGLYDACISGSGDHMMAHAFCGDWESPCIERILGRDSLHEKHFVAWCKRVYRDVRAKVGVVPGTLLHLWHGEMENRRYVLRNRELARFGFDPANDLRVSETGAWQWARENVELRRWAEEYYPSRKEDG